MGWASGFRAGSAMAGDWIDTYQDAKGRRVTSEIQDEIDAAKETDARRQFGIDRASVATGLSPQEITAQITGRAPGPTGLGAQQQADVVMGNAAPSRTGLSADQMSAAARAPSTSGGALRGEAYAPLSREREAQITADAYRSAGLVEEYRDAQKRLDALEEQSYSRSQDALKNEREGKQLDSDLALNNMTAELRKAQAANVSAVAEQRGMENAEAKAYIDARADFADSGMDVQEYRGTDEFKALPTVVKTRLIEDEAGLSVAMQASTTNAIKQKLDAAGSLEGRVKEYSNDPYATPDTDYKLMEAKDGTLELHEITMAENGVTIKDSTVVATGKQEDVDKWLYSNAQSPEAAADYAIGQRMRVAALNREIADLQNKDARAAQELFIEAMKIMQDSPWLFGLDDATLMEAPPSGATVSQSIRNVTGLGPSSALPDRPTR